MKHFALWVVLAFLTAAVPVSASAEVNINVGIPLPPPMVFPAPPEVIVIPDSPEVYAVPDAEAEIYFWDGWWWRLWDGRWYRSRYLDRGWVYFDYVPDFYFGVDPGWRRYYRQHNWHGHRWNYERIPAPRLQRNWRGWQSNRYWERRRKWDVQNYRPLPPERKQELRMQREQEYRQRPEVQRHLRERGAPPPESRPPESRPPRRPPERPEYRDHGPGEGPRPGGAPGAEERKLPPRPIPGDGAERGERRGAPGERGIREEGRGRGEGERGQGRGAEGRGRGGGERGEGRGRGEAGEAPRGGEFRGGGRPAEEREGSEGPGRGPGR